MTKPEQAIVQFKDVTKTYPLPRRSPFETKRYIKALDELSLDIYEGETIGVVGESGSGKSTLGRILAGLLKPDSGQVLLNGRSLSTIQGLDLHRDVQYIFQDPKASLNEHKSVRWLLEEPLKVQTDLTREQRTDRVHELLEISGLSKDYLDYYPQELSGGQAQRISILAALMGKPSVLIADEAVSALDVSVQAQILNFLSSLRDRFDLTMIFITHDIHVCYYMADRIAVMHEGRIVEEGPAEQVYRNPQHDYTKQLFASVLNLSKQEAAL